MTPRYTILVLHHGEWSELTFHDPCEAQSAWDHIPAGTFARYFMNGKLLRQGSAR
jgi:hypothetical protein